MEITLGPSKPIIGTLTVPADKSISHRALLLAAMAEGVSTIRNLLPADDPTSTLECLRSLGIEINQKSGITKVLGKGLHGLRPASKELDAGNSGTTLRLLSGVLAGQPFESSLTGDDSLRKRPMQRIVDPLTLMGARIRSSTGKAPLRIIGTFPLTPITYTLPFPSAQVKSAVLLAGLFADGTTTVVERVTTRDHTERMLGLARTETNDGFRVSVVGGTPVPAREILIPGDISSAVFMICAAALVPGTELTLQNVGLNPTRTAVLDVLREVGLALEVSRTSASAGEDSGTIHIRFSPAKRSINLSPQQVPLLIDEIPALAVLAAASGVGFTVAGAAELRAKESDRISILVRNLRALGLAVEEEPGGFSFPGHEHLTDCRVHSGGDHRIAMAFGIAGLGNAARISVVDAHVSDISYPGFWGILKSFQK